MLQSLDIKNAALISGLSINLDAGLNVLSGETGAGKSIIIDSLNFVLGSKADRTLIRHGTEKMTAEAVFEVDSALLSTAPFVEAGVEETTVIIQRSLSTDGRSEVRINGRAVTLAMLRAVTARLTDVYGQSEHISLLSPAVQLRLIDGFDKQSTAPIKQKLSQLCSKLGAVRRKLDSLGGDDRERQRLMELYEFQAREIRQAELAPEEEQQLLSAYNRYVNMQKISEDVSYAAQAVSSEQGALEAINAAAAALVRAARYDSGLSALAERLSSAALELEDLSGAVSDYLYSLDYDQQDAARTEARLQLIKTLKRKYGGSVQEVIEFGQTAQRSLEQLAGSFEQIEELKKDKDRLCAEIYDLSVQLSALRQDAARRFTGMVTSNLADLSMGGTAFEIEFAQLPAPEETELRASENGMDSVEFLIAPNPGQPLKPLSKIISGGEMSRFMLAVKNITRGIDNISTLVFDEIDTGISGETATAVAKKFAAIASGCQVIAITHLPQIAAMGDVNFLIKKTSGTDSTVTELLRLKGEMKEREIARLIGAADLSQHAVLHAKKLIDWSSDYKSALRI